MQKKFDLLPIIALVCAVIAVILSVFSMVSLNTSNTKIAQLELENKNLQEQMSILSASKGQISSDAYCHLLVNSWEGNLNELTLSSAIAQVVLPSSSETELLIQSSQLVLRQGIQEIQRRAVTLTATDSASSFEAVLENVLFELPTLEENDQVDIWLEGVLSDGQILLSPACGWYRFGDELFMVAG